MPGWPSGLTKSKHGAEVWRHISPRSLAFDSKGNTFVLALKALSRLAGVRKPGIKPLSELAGCVNSEFHIKKKSTRAQRRVVSHIAESYKAACDASGSDGAVGGLRDLCSSSQLYDSGRSDAQPYAKENISWPEASSQPVSAMGCLAKGDREWLGAWRTHMLRPSDDVVAEQEPFTPYIDPVLKHNKMEYAGFLEELHQRNMIGFTNISEYGGMLGVFFVKKNSGQLRLIFDTRKLNQLFRDPPNTDLPSAEAFTLLETVQDKSFYIAPGDLANAFYTLTVPEELGHMFTLPPIEVWRMSGTIAGGVVKSPGAQVVPFLKVLLMRWSWALHVCHRVLTHAIETAGFGAEQVIGDKGASVRLASDKPLAVAGYLDNFGVFGSDRECVNQGLPDLRARL